MNQHKQPSALKSVPTKLSNRTKQLDEISIAIAGLQRMRNELVAEIESLNQHIDDLKRTREIVRGMQGNDEQYI